MITHPWHELVGVSAHSTVLATAGCHSAAHLAHQLLEHLEELLEHSHDPALLSLGMLTVSGFSSFLSFSVLTSLAVLTGFTVLTSFSTLTLFLSGSSVMVVMVMVVDDDFGGVVAVNVVVAIDGIVGAVAVAEAHITLLVVVGLIDALLAVAVDGEVVLRGDGSVRHIVNSLVAFFLPSIYQPRYEASLRNRQKHVNKCKLLAKKS